MAEPQGPGTTARDGLVMAHHGRRSLVQSATGGTLECTLPRRLKPVCGDRVRYSELPDGGGHIVDILARRNEFPRVDSRGGRRVIAANLDRVLVVLAPRPEPTRYIVDRYLVAAHSIGVEPLLVANKSDMPEHDALMARLALYAGLDYTLVATDARSCRGVERLSELLHGTTGILAGQSGVGKSRLAACLLPGQEFPSAGISRATGKGRHTTTTARLFHLPGGGSLVDTPGVWEYGLWRMPREQIEAGFIEFRDFLGRCRFRDCRHLSEPGCAIRDAVDRGDVSQARYDAYRQILGEMEIRH